MSATVGWGRYGWDTGAWGTSPDALAVITGISSSTSVGNVFAAAPSLTTISGQVINSGVSNIIVGVAVTNLFITGQEVTSSINSVSFGEGREVPITGLSQLELELNFGNGWGREEWSSGAWGTPLGEVVTGDGNIFIEDGQSITTSVSNVANIIGNAAISVTGEGAVASSGNFIISSNNFLSTTGQQVTTSIGTYTIAAGGAITVVVPEFTINTSVGTINTGSASSTTITGQVLNTSSGSFIITADQILPITGSSANANVSSITISAEHFQEMTGQEMTTSLADFILSTNNFIIQTGQEMTVTPVNLRFWDPIADDNTETWTNI
mgnify:FL=1|tara:strand:- start:677 stop:1648 length:972 start_codon:yes stop_codon:yes gene_type:complete